MTSQLNYVLAELESTKKIYYLYIRKLISSCFVVSSRLSANSRVVMRWNFKLIRVALVQFLLEADFYFKFIYYLNVKNSETTTVPRT